MVKFIEDDQFGGVSTIKVDDKGRINLPIEFRRVLETRQRKFGKPAPGEIENASGRKKANAGQDEEEDYSQFLVLTLGKRTSHIECYPLDVWEKTKEWLLGLDDDNDGDRLRKYILGNREIREIDKLGRVLLSQELRDIAGIGTGEIKVMGFGETFGIWAKEIFETRVNVKGNEVEMGDLWSQFKKKSKEKPNLGFE